MGESKHLPSIFFHCLTEWNLEHQNVQSPHKHWLCNKNMNTAQMEGGSIYAFNIFFCHNKKIKNMVFDLSCKCFHTYLYFTEESDSYSIK